jgi:hypothetical protein
MSPRTKTRPRIRDFVDDDAQVIATEGFTALPLGRRVDRGTYFRLSDAIVHRHPAYFAIVVPVNQVLGEIER